MGRPQPLFDERVTMNKVDEYRSRIDDDSSGNRSSGTYDEMVEEVERVSEMLMQTQSKLWKSQDELKSYNSKTKVLQSTLEQRDHEIKRLRKENEDLRDEENKLRHEVEKLNRDVLDRDEGRARPELERRLRKAIEFLQKDLNASNEKHRKAQDEIQAQQKAIDELKKSNQALEESSQERHSKAVCSGEKLETCQKQLREATEGNATLLEEVAKLRDELNRTKKIADQKDVLIRREVEDSVKEKIKLEVSKTVSKQVTDRVTREVTTRMKAERDKELNSLREQIRKIVKENASLQSKIDGAERMASESNALQQDVQVLTYEITRYEAMIDEAKQEYEIRLGQIERDCRMKIQTVKDEAAKEKWIQASEIRKQMTVEREREVQNFTQRIEALSKQAERLLDRAEKDKEEYGMLMKKRAKEEMEREMKALTDKLDARTKESDQLIKDAKKDKEAHADQVRRTMEDEKRRDIGKYTYRIDVLVEENETWKKRIQSLEEELAAVWQESKGYVEQLKRCQSEMKCLEDENFKLKRKTQNFSTLITRYKQDAEEATKELQEAKQLFRDALLKSEGQNLKLKAKLNKMESKSTRDYHEESRELHLVEKKTLVDQIKVYERDISYLSVQNEKLRIALSKRTKQSWSDSRTKDWSDQIKSENIVLKKKIMSLESLIRDAKKESFAASDELLLAIEAESVQLQSSIDDMDALFQKYREEFQKSSLLPKKDRATLEKHLQSTTQLLDQYRSHRSGATKELELAKQMTEDALTVASEDDSVQLKHEIQTIERMLRLFNEGGRSTIQSSDKSVSLSTGRCYDERLERLQGELDSLGSLLEGSRHGTSQNEELDECTEKSISVDPTFEEKLKSELVEVKRVNLELEKRVESLNYVLEKYRGELSKASQDLEHTRQTLALEGETAQQLNRRVESLNLLLDTTEQNHAENNRELAQSRRLLEEAAIASKCEIDRLNDEIKQLNQSLARTQQERNTAHQLSDNVKHEYVLKLEKANGEILEWKRKLEKNVEEHQQHRLKAKEEYEKTKREYNDTIEQAEKEIDVLNNLIESLSQANLDYIEESKIHENEKKDLKKALRVSELHKGEQMKRMETLLRKAREGSKCLMNKLEESEKNFQRALKQSEEERNDLKKSLDDVKKTLLGQSFEDSSVDNSSRRMDRTNVVLGKATLQNPYDDLRGDIDDKSDAEDSSAEVFCRLDDLLGSRKKRVSWKDSDWDLDISTVATLTSQESKVEVSLATLPSADYLDTSSMGEIDPGKDDEDEKSCHNQENECESDHGNRVSLEKAKSSDSPVALTFEETIRWKRNKSASSVNGTSWDDSTNILMQAESREAMSTFPTNTDDEISLAEDRLGHDSSQRRSKFGHSDLGIAPKKKKAVRWEIQADEMTGAISSSSDASSHHGEDSRSNQRLAESREPGNDDTTGILMMRNIDHRDESSDCNMADFGIKSRDDQQSMDGDDESSTIDWNMLQPGDAADMGSDGSSVGLKATATSYEETYIPVNHESNLQVASFSSSFSYSTNGSSSDNEADEEDLLNVSVLGVSLENSSAPMNAHVENGSPRPPINRRRNKSGCQRAREKASRRNWTKEELNQFITRKKIGLMGQRRRPKTPHDQLNDTGEKGLFLREEDESRDAAETEELEASTIFTED